MNKTMVVQVFRVFVGDEQNCPVIFLGLIIMQKLQLSQG